MGPVMMSPWVKLSNPFRYEVHLIFFYMFLVNFSFLFSLAIIYRMLYKYDLAHTLLLIAVNENRRILYVFPNIVQIYLSSQ